MERFLVAFMAVTLLLSGAEHSRAEYRSAYEPDGPDGGPGLFLNPPGVATGLIEDILLADALTHPVQVFMITSLGSITTGNRRFFETGGTTPAPFGKAVPADSRNARPPRFESDAAFLLDSGCLCIGGGHSSDPCGLEAALSKNISVADSFIQRTEMLSGEDPFLANFGIAPAQSEPPRVAIDLSGSGSVTAMLLNHKLLSGLSLLGIVALGLLAFAWRQRRVVPHRGLRGPRGTALYRSSTPGNPRGTIR